MYSVITVLFVVGVCMFLVGVLGRAASGAMEEIDCNVAATLGLLVIYAFLLISFSSAADLLKIFETICGGIPYVSEIADYGSLRNVLHEAPLKVAIAFCDVVLLSSIINMLSLLPLTSGKAVGKIMVKILTAVVLALIALVILNFVKQSGPYRYLTAILGAIIALISAGSIPLSIIALVKGNGTSGAGLIVSLLILSKTKLFGILRDSFLKSLVYVGGIYVIECRFGTIANFMAQFSIFIVAFVPVLIMLIGITLVLKSVFVK